MGAAGYRGHIVVCGWNPTARDLIAELNTDDYEAKIVVIHTAEKNPCGPGVYYVSGDVTNEDDLKRAGIEEAVAGGRPLTAGVAGEAVNFWPSVFAALG